MITTIKTLARASFENIYRTEQNLKVKERMLLVLNVVYYGVIASQVSRDLHRSRAWACEWLKRYGKEGIDGLRDRTKTGRSPKLSEEVIYQITKELQESNNYGWTTKQVEELIVKKSGIKYHYTHIYHILRKWGFKQKVPRKVHVNTASKEEKDDFKKRSSRYSWINTSSSSSSSSSKRKKKDLP